MSFKDIYLDQVERIASELEEKGIHPDEAYERAGELAYDAARDVLADHADYLRMRAREP